MTNVPTTHCLQLRARLPGLDDFVHALAFSPDGRTLASGRHGNEVRLWDPATGALRQALRPFAQPVLMLAFSPDGARLAVATGEAKTTVWEATTGELGGTLKGRSKHLEFSPDGGILAAAMARNVVLWNAATLQPAAPLAGHAAVVDLLG